MKKQLSLVLVLALLLCSFAGLTSCTSDPPENSPAANTSGQASSGGEDADDPYADLEAVSWRFSTQSGGQTVVGKMANWIAEEVSARTNGKFTIEVYTDAILYSDRECIEALVAGSIEAGQGSYATLANFADYCNVVNLPYLASSWEELDALCFGEDYAGARQLLSDAIAETGLHPLSFYSTGLRNFSNNKHPVNSMADLAGLKVRVQQNDVYIDTFNALGAYPVPMAASEVLVSLQQGTIDAQENPLDFIYNDGFYEFQPYITCTKHIATFSGYYVSQKAWDALPEEFQKVYEEVTTEACQKIMEQTQAEEEEYRQILTDAGCEIIDLSEEALEEMRTVCKETVWPKYEDQYAEFLAYFQ